MSVPASDAPAPAEGPAEDPGEGPPGRGRRPLLWWVGLVLLLAGLGVLGYVGWQMYGTNIVSKQAQQRITKSLEEQWRSGRGKPPQFVPKGQASALIRIPKFGKDYVVPVLEGTSQDVLAQGFGHFTNTAEPGQVGNYAIAGHRVTHGQPLRDMPDLRPGDLVIVETATATYTYSLDTDPNALIIPFTGIWVLDPLPHNPQPGGVEPAQRKGQRLITLTTCSELFHTDNRMIAFGHLVAKRPKQTSPPDLGAPQW